MGCLASDFSMAQGAPEGTAWLACLPLSPLTVHSPKAQHAH